jgi:tetratricopeptide (TPR) repeat protein
LRRSFTIVFLLLAACGRPVPGLPEIQTAGFQPLVRTEVDKALAAAKAAPRDAGLTGRLGMLLHAHQQLAAAEACYLRAEALDSANFAWPYYLAHVQAELSRREQALASYRRALAIQPYAPAQLNLGRMLLEAGKPAEAEPLIQKALAADSQSAAAWYELGRTAAARNRPADAIPAFEKALAAFPNYGAAHYALAQALRQSGRAGETDEHLKAYARHKLEAPLIPDRYMAQLGALTLNATAFIRRSAEAEAEGKLDEAIQLNLRAVELDNRIAQAHVNLISLYGRTHKAAEAEEHYRKAVAIDANFADAHYNYGVLLLSQERLNEAGAMFTRALAINPQHIDALHNLGFLRMTERRLGDAAALFEKALAINPNHRESHFNLARVLIARNQYPQAVAHLERTLHPVDERTAGYLYALGAAYANTGRGAEALDRMRQARDMAQQRRLSGLLPTIERDLAALEKRLAR